MSYWGNTITTCFSEENFTVAKAIEMSMPAGLLRNRFIFVLDETPPSQKVIALMLLVSKEKHKSNVWKEVRKVIHKNLTSHHMPKYFYVQVIKQCLRSNFGVKILANMSQNNSTNTFSQKGRESL